MNVFGARSPDPTTRPPHTVGAVSKIPPRGYREPRKPKRFDGTTHANYPQNVPILNELVANEPRVAESGRNRPLPDTSEEKERMKKSVEKKTQAELQRMHRLRIDFFRGVTSPPESLPMPEDPTIEPISGVSIHRDPVPSAASVAVFAVKELQEIPSIVQDDDAVMMHAVHRM